jgi:hypothetical protein
MRFLYWRLLPGLRWRPPRRSASRRRSRSRRPASIGSDRQSRRHRGQRRCLLVRYSRRPREGKASDRGEDHGEVVCQIPRGGVGECVRHPARRTHDSRRCGYRRTVWSQARKTAGQPPRGRRHAGIRHRHPHHTRPSRPQRRAYRRRDQDLPERDDPREQEGAGFPERQVDRRKISGADKRRSSARSPPPSVRM